MKMNHNKTTSPIITRILACAFFSLSFTTAASALDTHPRPDSDEPLRVDWCAQSETPNPLLAVVQRNRNLERKVHKEIYDSPLVLADNVIVHANERIIALSGDVQSKRAKDAAIESVQEIFPQLVVDMMCIESSI